MTPTEHVLMAVIVGLVVLLLMAGWALLRAINEIIWLHEDLQDTKDIEHTRCMGAVMKFVGDEWAAQVLEVAAADYASADSHQDIDRIRRLLYREGGSPVPSIWLSERADKLRISLDCERSTILEETK